MTKNLTTGVLLLTMSCVTGSIGAQSSSTSASPAAATAGMPVDQEIQQTETDETRARQTKKSSEEVSLPESTNNAPTAYVSALDGTGLIAQDEAVRGRLLVGGNSSAGYDTNPNGLSNAPKSGTFIISPFVGIQANSANLHYVVQYQPTFRRYTASNYEGASLHVASADIVGRLSERWNWNALVLGKHGQESIGMLAPQQTVPIGDVPGTTPDGNAFNPDANTITSINGRAGVAYTVSARDTLGFGAENAFTSYQTLIGNSLIGTVNGAYSHAVTPAMRWITDASATRYYGLVHCYAYGGGVGIEWRPEGHTYLHLSGGPQLDSAACGKQQGFAYQADYSQRITPRSQFYLTSGRQVGSTDLGPGLWQETAAIGYQHDFERKESLAFDFGYLRTTGLQNTDTYSGKYVDGAYNRLLGHGLRAILSYRWYTGNTFRSNFTRTTTLLSIAWTPTPGHLFQ